MRTMNTHYIYRMQRFILVAAMLVALVSCQRRPLEYFYKPEAKIILKVDWTDFPEKPTGMTVFLFKDGETGQAFSTSEVDQTELNVTAGRYKLFVMNQSMTEFGGITFKDMYSYENAEAVISKVASKWYAIMKGVIASQEGDELPGVGSQPEDLGIAIAEEFTISEDEVKEFNYQYAKWRKGKGKQDGDGEAADDAPVDKDAPALRTISAVAHNVVSRLHVKIYFHNIPTLYSVRTSMEGLADSYMITQKTTSSRTVAQLMEKWDIHVTSADGVDGYVETTIHTFALPDGVTSVAQRDPRANIFTVQALHKDLKTITEEVYTVGDKFKISFPGKIRMQMDLEVGPINLPYSPGGDAGGFISYVEDWDDVIDVPIPI